MSVGVAISPMLALAASETKTEAINEFKLADGLVSDIKASDLEQSITNKPMIVDPTGKTEGYLLEDYSEDTFELIGSRGQTSRHFYDKATREYTYQSDSLVQKEGVFEETVWVTAEEYPHRFLLRLRNSEIYLFETASEITTFLNRIDRTSIWAVGIRISLKMSCLGQKSMDITSIIMCLYPLVRR